MNKKHQISKLANNKKGKNSKTINTVKRRKIKRQRSTKRVNNKERLFSLFSFSKTEKRNIKPFNEKRTLLQIII